MIPKRALAVAFFLLLIFPGTAPRTAAQPTPPVDRFDLVLFGTGLNAPSHRVALKTNPWRGDAWTPIGDASGSTCGTQPHLRIVRTLATARYLGQDIRENYIALKVTTQPRAEGTLRAAYALPSADRLDEAACERLATLIATEPSVVRRHSIASHVRPRPAPLSAEAPFIEHLEAAVRHRKPGVMEVEWLEILFSQGE